MVIEVCLEFGTTVGNEQLYVLSILYEWRIPFFDLRLKRDSTTPLKTRQLPPLLPYRRSEPILIHNRLPQQLLLDRRHVRQSLAGDL